MLVTDTRSCETTVKDSEGEEIFGHCRGSLHSNLFSESTIGCGTHHCEGEKTRHARLNPPHLGPRPCSLELQDRMLRNIAIILRSKKISLENIKNMPKKRKRKRKGAEAKYWNMMLVILHS